MPQSIKNITAILYSSKDTQLRHAKTPKLAVHAVNLELFSSLTIKAISLIAAIQRIQIKILKYGKPNQIAAKNGGAIMIAERVRCKIIKLGQTIKWLLLRIVDLFVQTLSVLLKNLFQKNLAKVCQ